LPSGMQPTSYPNVLSAIFPPNGHPRSHAHISAESRPVPAQGRVIPRVYGADGWRQVLKDWEHPDNSRSLAVALKDWPEEWYSRATSSSKDYGSLYNQRRLIATEYIER
jgi:hypothetical protein